jgi:chemotaxis protein histidine kinase CheA
MAGKIFISYRRDDSRYQAQRIYEAFLRGLPRENIFMDVDAIPLGVNFAKVLEGWLEQCDVLLVLMGAGWANSTDSKTGRRRLDNQKDFVRVEIRAALTRDIPVVPVLLDGAELPEEAELPDDIKGLLNRNAEFIEYRTFDADVQRLIRKLGVGGSTKRGASPAIIAETPRDQAIEEHDSRSSAESLEAQGDLADKPREKKPLVKEWTKGWLTPTIVATVLLAAAAIGILAFWSPGLLSGKRVEITAKGADSARQAAEARAVEAEKAGQAAEARAADAEKARQVAEAKTADAEKARQAAEARATDAEKARQAAQAQSANAEKSRQAAEAKLADAENARQAAEAKIAEAEAKATQMAEAAQATAEDTHQTAEANAPATVTSSLFTRRTNFEARGRRLDSFIPDVASVSICEQYCARSSRCNAFAYNKTNGDCYKYAVFELVLNEHFDSGIRQQAISAVPEVEPNPERPGWYPPAAISRPADSPRP